MVNKVTTGYFPTLYLLNGCFLQSNESQVVQNESLSARIHMNSVISRIRTWIGQNPKFTQLPSTKSDLDESQNFGTNPALPTTSIHRF
jgi:hypothetical protein